MFLHLQRNNPLKTVYVCEKNLILSDNQEDYNSKYFSLLLENLKKSENLKYYQTYQEASTQQKKEGFMHIIIKLEIPADLIMKKSLKSNNLCMEWIKEIMLHQDLNIENPILNPLPFISPSPISQ